MKKMLVPLLLLGAAWSLGAEIDRQTAKKITALTQEALSLFQEKEYGKANDRYQEILGLLPQPKDGPHDRNRAHVLFNMAANYSFLGKKKEALETLDKAIVSGFWNADYLVRDETWKDLRADKEFQALIEKSRRALPEMAFGLKDVTGKEIKKDDHQGKVLILDVFGTWCPPCVMEIPHFVKLQERYGKDGLQVIGLSWERVPPDDGVRKRVERFAGDKKLNYPVALLPEGLLNALNVNGFPTTFFIGRDGTVAERATGYREYAELEKVVRKLLARKGPNDSAPDRAPGDRAPETKTSP